MVISEYSTGIFLSVLSIVIDTSANPTGLLLAVPAKITSSILPPLRLFALCSPNTHLTASDMLLFPLPLGPTTAVIPLLNSSFTFSGKDLKPCKSSSFKYIGAPHQKTVFPPTIQCFVLPKTFFPLAGVNFALE